MRPAPHVRISVLTAVLVLAAPHLAAGAWPHNPGVNLPVCTASNQQDGAAIASDGAGGAIVAWHDSRGTSNDIYAQHIPASGVVDPAWPVNGRALCTASLDQISPAIVADGAGGAIVAWSDYRAGNSDIYAAHILSSGVVDPAWPVNGRALCSAAFDQYGPSIASDGAGGAIVAWTDARGGVSSDIYAQHVQAAGAVDPAWPVDGRALCAAADNQSGPRIAGDGAGGAIAVWTDHRSGTQNDIYAQHVLASGAVDFGWGGPNGRALCTAPQDQYSPTIVSDGSGGAIAAWIDPRNGTDNDIYAQHVLASGTIDPSWPSDGRALCTASGGQYDPAIAGDGAGGAIVAWGDLRGINSDIYAQHVSAGGAVDAAWPANGRVLCAAALNQDTPKIISDGAGGAIAIWNDTRNGISDIYAQHVQATGVVDPVWPVDGRAVRTASGNQYSPVLASDGAGGAIVAWPDPRSGSTHIYAQRVARFGYLGTPEAEIIGVKDVPNDNGGKVKVSWYASWLDTESDPNLTSYEIYRSAAPNLVAAEVAKGAQLLTSPGDVPVPGRRAFLTAVQGTSVYAWEYLTMQAALHYIPAYSYIAATASDSSGAYNPRTAFMIVARNSSGSMYWLSRPDSGYSVDNIPPITPAPFVGNYAAGATHLHWDPNPEADLAGYRLYRGATSSFVPGPGNLVSDQPDTGYVDAGAAGSYYKLAAVDVHGNLSPYALLTPAQTTGVAPGAGLELTLAAPDPNPAHRDAGVRFTLPRTTPVTVAVFDLLGRRARVLADGIMPAGQHAIRWDLRDDAGRPVANGLYLVRLTAEGRTLTRRLAAIR
jgi:hypothetical protein